MHLAAYRASAEAFSSELTRAYYRHYAGLEAEYAIEPIYERHAELFDRASVDGLRELVGAAPEMTDERRRLAMLLDFAVQGYIGQSTKELDAELARRESGLSLEVDGQRVGFRASIVLQANEPDAERRAVIEQQRLAATDEHLNPLYNELISRQHDHAALLGYGSYGEMCQECKGIDLAALQAQTDAFSAATADSYPAVLEPELRRTLGLGLAELRRSDLPRFFRAVEGDGLFPADRLVESMLETMRGLGIAEQRNVLLDVDPRPNKSPRAFCAPVRVPQEVYLVIAPVGGRDDFSALFHESGHTEHYAHVDPQLPFEFRYLGDNSITESFAFLFQHLVEDPVWLERRLGVSDPAEAISYARAHRLLYLRRTPGSSPTRWSSTDRGTRSIGSRSGTRRCSAARCRSSGRGRRSSGRRPRVLLRLLPARVDAGDLRALVPLSRVRAGVVRFTGSGRDAALAVERGAAADARRAAREAVRRPLGLRSPGGGSRIGLVGGRRRGGRSMPRARATPPQLRRRTGVGCLTNSCLFGTSSPSGRRHPRGSRDRIRTSIHTGPAAVCATASKREKRRQLSGTWPRSRPQALSRKPSSTGGDRQWASPGHTPGRARRAP